MSLSAQTPAQAITSYKLGLILPFQTESTSEKLDEIANAHDLFTANKVRFNDEAIYSLDFYQGLLLALKENPDSIVLELHVYDCRNSDSLTAEILRKPEIRSMDFIIGSVSSSGAKLVADFCKTNHIINLQPFTPSKSLTSENPYHLKLAPTIDSHIDNLFQSILDSFQAANVVIYTPKVERSFPLALQYDSLFRIYDSTAEKKYTVSLINATDQTVDGVKTTVSELLKPEKTNVLIVTSYDEPFIQSTLRTVFEKQDKSNIIVYGLPTWLHGEILRLDYLNAFHTRLSDPFFADTTKPAGMSFMEHYFSTYNVEPDRYAYLGYDVMNFLMRSVKTYGKDFLSQIVTQRYTGTGYKFDIAPVTREDGTINYYENSHVNVLKVEDYRLVKVW